MGTEKQYFQSPEDKARLASPHQIVQRRLSDDGQRWIVVERWLDTQVQPPKWRSRNRNYPLTKSEAPVLRRARRRQRRMRLSTRLL